jgi:two-component system, OmpR family, alkaline phosphatase synthesis response regulator PhoP
MTQPYEILVVDDDMDIRDSLKIILEKNGYRVRLAKNGSEALKELNVKKPDIMILDIMMSTDTEGFDLAFELKNSPEFENLPIIMLTSFMEKVREEGPDQFQHILGEEWPAKWLFEKPIDSDKLLKKLDGILKTS